MSTQPNMPLQAPSIDQDEIAKFDSMAEEWWDEGGKFKPLHIFNPVRIKYIRDNLCRKFRRDAEKPLPLKGIKILDIGCGGGLLAEPLTRLGADVTGIDASAKNINIASLHAAKNDLDIEYINISAEELAAQKRQFDVVLNMEVIEHVADVKAFIASCCTLLKPGGFHFIATLNRTVKSYGLAIIGAEYILRWLPRGTHDWNKFLKPSEITKMLAEEGLSLKEIQGVSFSPFAYEWKLSTDIDVNYIILAEK